MFDLTPSIPSGDASFFDGNLSAAQLLRRLCDLLEDTAAVPFRAIDALEQLWMKDSAFRSSVKKLTSLGYIQGTSRQVAKQGDQRACKHFLLNLEKIREDLGWSLVPTAIYATPLGAPKEEYKPKLSPEALALIELDIDAIDDWAVATPQEPVKVKVADAVSDFKGVGEVEVVVENYVPEWDEDGKLLNPRYDTEGVIISPYGLPKPVYTNDCSRRDFREELAAWQDAQMKYQEGDLSINLDTGRYPFGHWGGKRPDLDDYHYAILMRKKVGKDVEEVFPSVVNGLVEFTEDWRNRIHAFRDNYLRPIPWENTKEIDKLDPRYIVYQVNSFNGAMQKDTSRKRYIRSIKAITIAQAKTMTRMWDSIYDLLPSADAYNWVSPEETWCVPEDIEPEQPNVIIRDFDGNAGVSECHVVWND